MESVNVVDQFKARTLLTRCPSLRDFQVMLPCGAQAIPMFINGVGDGASVVDSPLSDPGSGSSPCFTRESPQVEDADSLYWHREDGDGNCGDVPTP